MTPNTYSPKDSSAWKTFTMASFAVAAIMMAGGIYFMEATAKLAMVKVFQALESLGE